MVLFLFLCASGSHVLPPPLIPRARAGTTSHPTDDHGGPPANQAGQLCQPLNSTQLNRGEGGKYIWEKNEFFKFANSRGEIGTERNRKKKLGGRTEVWAHRNIINNIARGKKCGKVGNAPRKLQANHEREQRVNVCGTKYDGQTNTCRKRQEPNCWGENERN